MTTIDEVAGLRAALDGIHDTLETLRSDQQTLNTKADEVKEGAKTDLQSLDDNTVMRHNDLTTRHNRLSYTSMKMPGEKGRITNLETTPSTKLDPIVDEWANVTTYLPAVKNIADEWP